MNNRCTAIIGHDWYYRTDIPCHRLATITLDGLRFCNECAERHARYLADVQKLRDLITPKEKP